MSPLVVSDTQVIRVVQPRDLDKRTGCSTTRPVDLQLSALNVELSPPLEAFMQTDVLHPHKVLARTE